jgi:hypothetical protein
VSALVVTAVTVIRAKSWIQDRVADWIPAFAGMTEAGTTGAGMTAPGMTSS